MTGRKGPQKKVVIVRNVGDLLNAQVRQRRFGDLPTTDSEDSDYYPGLSGVEDISSESTSETDDSETEDSETEDSEAEESKKPSTSGKRRKTPRKLPAKKAKKASSGRSRAKPSKPGASRRADSRGAVNGRGTTTAASTSAASTSSASTSSASSASSARAEPDAGVTAVKCPVIISKDCNVPPLPYEIWVKIFELVVNSMDCVPFLRRASRVCSLWKMVAEDSRVWRKVDLSYGFVKSTKVALQWLAEHRLKSCRELSLASWGNLQSDWLKCVAEHCKELTMVNLNYCKKLSSEGLNSLVSGCPKLRGLSFAFTSTDCVSTSFFKRLVKARGSQLTHLEFGGNQINNFNGVLNLLMSHCPQLEVLDLSNMRLQGRKMVPVEKMHQAWPRLRVLRASGLEIQAAPVSQETQDSSPGFPALQELSLSTCTDVWFGSCNTMCMPLLTGLTRHAQNLRLLDLRGCRTFSSKYLKVLCATSLEYLYISSMIISPGYCLYQFLAKHRHSLVELNVSSMRGDWVLCEMEALAEGDGSPCLEFLDMSNTAIDKKILKYILKKTPKLQRLNLQSCWNLHWSIALYHRRPDEIQRVLKLLKY